MTQTPSLDRRFLSGRAIGVSISESPDVEALGLSDLHLEDAMTEIGRYILAAGGTLVYGGDLRRHGFTTLLLELVGRYHTETQAAAGDILVRNYLPWPVHLLMKPEEIEEQAAGFKRFAEIHRLDRQGVPLKAKDQPTPTAIEKGDWDGGLSAMRLTVDREIFARLVLGGRTEGYKGRMPGIAEEALIALQQGRPLYLIGGFGGCARDVAAAVGLAKPSPANPQRTWANLADFSPFRGTIPANGLTQDENRCLAETPHLEEIIDLLLRGLRRIAGRPNASGTT